MKKLICFGDSLTFGLGIRHNQKWTALVQQETSWTVVNQGINGDTAGGILARLQPFLQDPSLKNASAEHPYVLVMGGSNDIFYSGSDLCARAHMGAAIHQLRAVGTTPMIGIPLGVDAAAVPELFARLTDFSAAARTLDGYCRWLKAFCAAFAVPFVDFRADFQNPDGSIRSELFADGLHPNAAGHRMMADRLKKAVEHL